MQRLRLPPAQTSRRTVADGRIPVEQGGCHFRRSSGVNLYVCVADVTHVGRYGNADVALNTGTVLKDMLRYEPLTHILLYSDQYVTAA